MEPTPKYPEARMNAFGVKADSLCIAAVAGRALQRAGVSKEECDLFYKEALQVDYQHTLSTAVRWVTVEWIEPDDGYDEADSDE